MTERIYTPGSDYVTATKAAKELGVGVDLIHGLVNNRQLAGVTQRNGKGNLITMVSRDALVALKERIAQQRG